mgnify:CR=1 FL=1
MKLLDQSAQTNWKFIAIVAFVAVFLAGGILMLIPQFEESTPPLSQQNNSQVDTSGPALSEVEGVYPESIEGWQTYRSDEFEFEVKYPENVSIEKQSDRVFLSVRDRECNSIPKFKCPDFMAISKISLPSAVKVSPEESLEKLIEFHFFLPGFEVKEFEVSAEKRNWEIDLVKKMAFGKENIQGYLIHDWGMSTGRCTYFGKQNNSTIQISRTEGGLINSNCGADQLFSQILSTFRFAE